jgi:hypothetical protein
VSPKHLREAISDQHRCGTVSKDDQHLDRCAVSREPFHLFWYGLSPIGNPSRQVGQVTNDAEARIPNDRVRAYALWEGLHGYDRKKYTAMLREAFEPLMKPLALSSSLFPPSIP